MSFDRVYRPFDPNEVEPEYDEEDRIFALAYAEDEKIQDHLAEEEWEMEMLAEAYPNQEEEIQQLIQTEPQEA